MGAVRGLVIVIIRMLLHLFMWTALIRLSLQTFYNDSIAINARNINININVLLVRAVMMAVAMVVVVPACSLQRQSSRT